MSPSSPSHPQRRRRLRVLTGTVAASAAVACVLALGSEGAVAATTYNAQSVGRFLDGSVGGHPIQSLADLKDARAYAPGRTSQQNPLDAKLLNALELPLGHALQLPGGGVFKLGAANQVAVAHISGYSYGASGAVSNSGGVSLGGNNGAYPADATIDLSSAALGSVGIPELPGLPKLPGLPGVPGVPGGSAAALGGIHAQIGAVSALAKTRKGGAFATPQYQIAGLKLVLGSPALGGLLKQLAQGGAQLQAILKPILDALSALQPPVAAPKDCTITSGHLPKTLNLDNGAVVLDPVNGAITIDLEKLLEQLHLNLNDLPPNTDLLAYVLNNLGTILSTGLESVVNGIINPLQKQGQGCLDALDALPVVGKVLTQLFDRLKAGQAQLESTINEIASKLSSAGAPGLKALTDNLAKVVAIGVNVQQGAFPLSSEAGPKYKFTSGLKSTPDQATSVVAGQGVERAIEIALLGGQVALSLGNAAAGPSHPPAPTSSAPPTTAPPTSGAPNTDIPTGIPAGMAGHGGSPALPLTLLVIGLLVAGGGTITWRMRAGRHSA